MGGRGRGRGGANTGGLTFEQLQSLGVSRGEVASGAGSGGGPPPLFPKLEARPLPLVSSASVDYMLILKRQFLDYLHDSPSFVQTFTLKTDVERYSDKYKVLSSEAKITKAGGTCWGHLPAELRPQQTRKTRDKKRKIKTVDINTKLKKLEQKELSEKEDNVKEDGDEGKKGTTGGVGEEGDEEENEAGEDVEDPDEEMDDGTDYVDNYFDNGEGFEDEDENLEDGPVY